MKCPALVPCMLCLCACAGPRPQVVTQHLEAPRTAEAPYVLTATIRNNGGGDGQVEAVARLVSKATRETVAQSTQDFELRGYESLQVVFRFEGAPVGDYTVKVEAKYPP